MLKAAGKDFVRFARKVLSENRPIGTDHLSNSLALRLQDGTTVPVINDDADALTTGGAPGGILVSGNQKQHSDGRGTTVRTPSFGVTGADPPK